MPDLNYLQQLKNYVISNYDQIMKLPENEKNQLLKTLYAIQEIEYSSYRLNELTKAGLISEANSEQQKINSLLQKIGSPNIVTSNLHDNYQTHQPHRNERAGNNGNSVNAEAKVQQIMNFMRKHIQRVGGEQAIKDFQYGLNLLNRKRKNSTNEAFHRLKEDGDFGNKTYNCIANLCKFYSPKIICKSIQKAAVTNAIFDTKNNKRISTEKKIEHIKNDLNVEGRL